jgi:hypothetical protein
MLADLLSSHISGAKRRGHRWQTDAVIKPEARRLAENVSPLLAYAKSSRAALHGSARTDVPCSAMRFCRLSPRPSFSAIYARRSNRQGLFQYWTMAEDQLWDYRWPWRDSVALFAIERPNPTRVPTQPFSGGACSLRAPVICRSVNRGKDFRGRGLMHHVPVGRNQP